MRAYTIVKVLARLGGRVVMKLIYYELGGMSRGAAKDCRVGMGIAATRECATAW